MIAIEEPAWMKTMESDDLVKTGEVKNAFGIHPNSCVNTLILNKVIPAPIERKKRGNYRPNDQVWKVSDLRKVFKKD